MDYSKVLRELRADKAKLDTAIATLESLIGGKGEPITRSRKGMSENQRKEVSERMRNYWASRRDLSTSSKVC